MWRPLIIQRFRSGGVDPNLGPPNPVSSQSAILVVTAKTHESYPSCFFYVHSPRLSGYKKKTEKPCFLFVHIYLVFILLCDNHFFQVERIFISTITLSILYLESNNFACCMRKPFKLVSRLEVS